MRERLGYLENEIRDNPSVFENELKNLESYAKDKRTKEDSKVNTLFKQDARKVNKFIEEERAY